MTFHGHPAWRRRLLTVVTGLAAAQATGCERPVTERIAVFPVVIEVVDAKGAAIAGARITVAGLDVPEPTGPEGNWSLELRGKPGEVIPVVLTPPNRYVLRGSAERPVELRIDAAAGGTPLTSKERFVLDSTLRDGLLLLSIDCTAVRDPECGRIEVLAGDQTLGVVPPYGLFARPVSTWVGERYDLRLRPSDASGIRFQPDTIVFTPTVDGEILVASRTPAPADGPPPEPSPPTEPPPAPEPVGDVAAVREQPWPEPAVVTPSDRNRTNDPFADGPTPRATRKPADGPSIWDEPPRAASAAAVEPEPEPRIPSGGSAGNDPEQAEFVACQRRLVQKRTLGPDCADRFAAVQPGERQYAVAREALFNDAKGRRDWARAMGYAEELSRQNDGDPEWHYWRGYLEMKRSRYREAARSLVAAHQRQNTWGPDRRGGRTLQTIQNLAFVYTQLALRTRSPEPDDKDRAITYWQMAKDLARQVGNSDILRDADREIARLRSSR